jgi:hypothetical protein
MRLLRHISNVIYLMMRGATIADAWSVESSPNDVIIIHTHNKVIVAFQHGSQM